MTKRAINAIFRRGRSNLRDVRKLHDTPASTAHAQTSQSPAQVKSRVRRGPIGMVAIAVQDEVRAAIAENTDGANAAIASINEVQDLFRKQMGLQAPVQYWTDKASAHRSAAAVYRNVLIGVGALGLGGCVAAYFYVFDFVVIGHEGLQNSVSASLLSFGGLALLTTAALWIARILSRLYLSQHHLAIDAEERATMVTTYLALNKERAADEKDRAIMLAALFRPTADGIVREEAPPMTSPASFFSGVLSGPRQ